MIGMIRSSARSLLFLLLAAGLTTRSAAAAAINTDMALTPSEGTTIVRTQLRFLRATDDPSGLGREKDQTVWSTTVVYGVTGKLTLGFNLPLVDVTLDSDAGRIMDVTGAGDITLMGKYRFWQRDRKGSTDRISALLALEVPSGIDELSSHSVDPAAGVVYTHQSLDSAGLVREIDADVVFKVNTKARGTNPGDVARYDVAFARQLWPRRTADRLLVGVLELNGVLTGRDRTGGIDDPDSGGHRLYFSPGLELVTKRFIVEVGAKIPLVQNLNGNQLKEDYSLSLGVRFQF